jgi:hypothetical protein
MELFKCDFEDLFSVVMVNPNNGAEQLMVRETRRSA